MAMPQFRAVRGRIFWFFGVRSAPVDGRILALKNHGSLMAILNEKNFHNFSSLCKRS
jgi:hypothetical protein